jgi:tRNA nucleotidyltransferase (CCA-adding enzyme)
VRNGEVDHLVPERVWLEFSRGLMEGKPSRMLLALRDCGALERIVPEVDALFGVPQPAQHHPEVDTGLHILLVVDYAATHNHPLTVRFAALTHDLGKAATPREHWPKHHGHELKSVELVERLCERLRVPRECRDLAVLAARYHGDVHRAEELRPVTVLKLFSAADVYRRPERFEELLAACSCDYHGRSGFESRAYPQADLLRAAAAAARAVDAGGIAQRVNGDPGRIAAAIEAARLAAVSRALSDMHQR